MFNKNSCPIAIDFLELLNALLLLCKTKVGWGFPDKYKVSRIVQCIIRSRFSECKQT